MRLAIAVVLAALVAGCVGDSGGSAKLSYEGTSIGTHSDSSDCDKEGHLLGSGSIERGSVRVTVTTDDGERYGADFTGDFNLASQELTGQSGRWTLNAARIGGSNLGLSGFDGSYSFTMTC
jgi:FlaG/FlaF family flagellin (archaellin)